MICISYLGDKLLGQLILEKDSWIYLYFRKQDYCPENIYNSNNNNNNNNNNKENYNYFKTEIILMIIKIIIKHEWMYSKICKIRFFRIFFP